MAPEQAVGEDVDGRADLYALGVLFYEMLCGVRPFEAESRVALLGMVATRSPPRIAARVPGARVPTQLESIALRLLAKRRDDRFGSAEHVVQALDAAARELGIPIVAPSAARGSMGSVPEVARSEARPHAGAAAGITPKAAVTGYSSDPVVGGPDARGSGSSLPVPVRLAVAGVLGVTLLVPIATALRGTDSSPGSAPASGVGSALPPDGPSQGSTIAPEPSRGAPPGELTEARARGVTALERLAERFPEDPAVLLALAAAHGREASGSMRALDIVKRVLERDPRVASDADVQRLVRAGALGAPDTTALAFDLMAVKMGSAGPDLLYELAVKEPRVKERALRLLATPAVLEQATPALRIARDLRLATTCQAKKPLLRKAEQAGDERSVAILSPLLVTSSRGCGIFGLQPCPAPCAAIASEIRAAIQAIEARPHR